MEATHMTIKKTSKAAKQALSTAKHIVRFSLENGFSGEVVTKPAILTDRLNSEGSKLFRGSNGVYTLRVHSNLWYEFEVTA
jgi:hypothetical protein